MATTQGRRVDQNDPEAGIRSGTSGVNGAFLVLDRLETGLRICTELVWIQITGLELSVDTLRRGVPQGSVLVLLQFFIITADGPVLVKQTQTKKNRKPGPGLTGFTSGNLLFYPKEDSCVPDLPRLEL
ncbi:Hypothetical predicted protein [Xyrichtys novacula]|uniref:Uncharacterized protein n=1 Tax=Xyrichtys novacula TaxID=13765 RepID=A0AAV1H632_XYRNO|nr:Hypothetical predicted protein [Xyrichtys novacula]